LNKVILIARIVRDIDVKYSQGENPTAVARFSVAVDRKFKNAQGEYEADFPSCLAFGKTAEFITKYFSKGMKIGIEGRIQTGQYEKDGVKHYTTEIVIDQAEFVEAKKDSGQGGSGGKQPSLSEVNDFIPVSGDLDDSSLPFN